MVRARDGERERIIKERERERGIIKEREGKKEREERQIEIGKTIDEQTIREMERKTDTYVCTA